MSHDDWMLWSHEPPKLASPSRKPEQLFAMVKPDEHYYCVCELHYHGEYGVEAQFHLNGNLEIGRTFPMRKLAVEWAESEREARLREGWVLAR